MLACFIESADPNIFFMHRRRKNIRLKGFDYSSDNKHFVTICTKDRKRSLGDPGDNKIILSKIGEIAEISWKDIPNHFTHVVLDEFVIMPDHIHGIIELYKSKNEYPIGTCHGMSLLKNDNVKFNKFGNPITGSLSVVINHFKSAVKRWCNRNGYESFAWQPRFYDHIINSQRECERIRKYIKSNPIRILDPGISI